MTGYPPESVAAPRAIATLPMTENLLQREWTAAELEAVLTEAPRTPLLPPLDSEAWRRVAGNPAARSLLQPLRLRAEAEWDQPLPVLTDELYASFRATGRRIDFEEVYFERRRRLGRAAASLLLAAPDDPWRERFAASVVAKLTSIFEEVSWALPAHVHWHDDDVSGKEPLQIDLFCAETANLMAESLDLFGAMIPAELRERIRLRLRHAIFENYLDRPEPFHWTKVIHNWNAVCHQGVIGSALSQLDDVPMLARMLLAARPSLRLFLSGFSPDGGCSEGAGYWSYGFGWFAILNQQLEARTGNGLSLFEGDGHIREIARFGPRMALAKGRQVNFADNGGDHGLPPTLLSYLGHRLGEADCRGAAEDAFRILLRKGIAMDGERCDLFFLGRLLLHLPAELPPAGSSVAEDCLLPDLAVAVARGIDRRGHLWELAAKGGHNDEHHNHNDCGGFLLNIDGCRLLTEIGAPEYVKDFFSPKRYEFLAARTLGHPLPIINGCEQAAGAAHASRILSHSFSQERAELVVDVTACYPAEAGCRSFVRSLRLDKLLGKLTVSDEFVLDRHESLESALITPHPVALADDKSSASIMAEGLSLEVRPLAGTQLDRVESHSYQSHEGKAAAIHRLVYRAASLQGPLRLAIEMELAPWISSPL